MLVINGLASVTSLTGVRAGQEGQCDDAQENEESKGFVHFGTARLKSAYDRPEAGQARAIKHSSRGGNMPHLNGVHI